MRNVVSKTGWLVTVAVLVAVLAAACKPGDPARSTGAYPIDLFQEMHYNQTYKAQEPPRFLPPEDSYPVSGGFIPAGTKTEMREATSPFPINVQTIERGALLYKQNCSMCHGLIAGDDEKLGEVGEKFDEYIGIRPPAFASKRVQDLTPGEAFASISRGFGFMPPFQGLLSEEDRWALVALIEATTVDRNVALDAVSALDEPERTLRLLELREASK